MRNGIVVVVIALGISVGIAHVWDDLTTAGLSEEARLAIDVGCRGRKGQAARDCSAMLKKLYISGSLDPDKTLRAYCDRVRAARWGGTRPTPPKMCIERYGGWEEG